VAVLVGSGGNGGVGLVSARRLAEWGAVVQVVLANESDRLSEVAGHQLAILERVGVPYTVASDDAVAIPAEGMVIDVLVGYSLSGGLRGAAAALIHEANGTAAPVLSLDVPSGVYIATGEVYEPAIEANATLTLALPKVGLRAAEGRPHVGDLYLGGHRRSD
jgi:NAD(P)H-hydrate epimerase